MSKRPLFYISKQSNTFMETSSDVVLSPEFYWVKGIELNQATKRQIKSMAASVFSGYLPKGEYRYEVWHIKDNRWVIAAYDKEAIIKELTKRGIHTKKIIKVYLAQSLHVLLEKSLVNVEEKSTLALVDGIVCYFEGETFSNAYPLTEALKKLELKRPVDFGSMQDEVIPRTTYYQLLVLGMTILSTFIISLWTSFQHIEHIKEEKKELLANSGLPSTSFERDSILAPLKKKASLRQETYLVLQRLKRLSHFYRQELTGIRYEGKTLILTFRSVLPNPNALRQELGLKKGSFIVKTEKMKSIIKVTL